MLKLYQAGPRNLDSLDRGLKVSSEQLSKAVELLVEEGYVTALDMKNHALCPRISYFIHVLHSNHSSADTGRGST